MKKGLMVLLLSLMMVWAFGQGGVIVSWNFGTSGEETWLATGGLQVNSGEFFQLMGAAFSGWVWGYVLDSRAPNANNWHDQLGNRYWACKFNTEGYAGITVTSHQRSSATGPRDWQLEYKVGAAGTWTAVPGGELQFLVDNWDESASIEDLLLPSAVDDQEEVHLRWVMTSLLNIRQNVPDEPVGSTGTNRISEIEVKYTGTGVEDWSLY